jgi:ornithine carbamoyltransferase
VTVTRDPREAVQGVSAVVTDCFVSMADDPGRNSHAALAPYRVTTEIMELAARDALFMHCLPAHRGEEVESAVIDGRWSVVFDEAENRLHAQKGILAWVLGVR